MNKYHELQELLGVEFEDEKLLITALTHSSYANEKKNVLYNERLEFLGDSVLQLTISMYLFSKDENKSEGELTKLRSLIVCENSLYEIALKWELGKYLRMSKGEELTGGRCRVSILADAVEAVIAAVYLDRGIERAQEFIKENFKAVIDKAVNNEIILDYKTTLQERLQKTGEVSIDYDVVKEEGPAHRRIFYTEVKVNGEFKGKGSGYSKKEAEQNAAKEAIAKMEGINE